MMRLRPVFWLRETVREWAWMHTGMGLLLGSLALFNMGALLFYSNEFAYQRAWVYNVFEFGLPGVLALRVADRAAADGVPRVLAYGVAVVGVIVTGVWVIGPLMFPLIGGEPDWNSGNDVILAFGLLLPLSLGTVAYAHWRRGSDTLQRLQNAESARAREEQALQSARLLALQARVEPQFLFDTLKRVMHQVGDAAGPSPPAAEQLLADLSALLRAMQPAVGATASTVQRELALVQAYARAADAPALQAPRLQWHCDADAATARLAPMFLLPMLRQLVGDAPAGAWRVRVSAPAPRLHIHVQPSAPDWATTVALNALDINALQARAHAVHGPGARLVAQAGTSPGLLIDLPLTKDVIQERHEL
jgi:Histidine kinase